MLREATSRQQRRHTRMCLCCGYGGRELQREQLVDYACPRCGCDLYARPPRSYAEMEGFEATTPSESSPLVTVVKTRQVEHRRLLDRLTGWATISFILVLLLVIAAQAMIMTT